MLIFRSGVLHETQILSFHMFGRRPIFLSACLVQTLALAASAASWNFTVYCVAAFVGGIGGVITFIIAFIINDADKFGSKLPEVLSIGD